VDDFGKRTTTIRRQQEGKVIVIIFILLLFSIAISSSIPSPSWQICSRMNMERRKGPEEEIGLLGMDRMDEEEGGGNKPNWPFSHELFQGRKEGRKRIVVLFIG
jgi:hypothetical protein